MARPAHYVTAKIQSQFDCEQLMSSDYYSCCMCGSNGDHSELDTLKEEEWEYYLEYFIF